MCCQVTGMQERERRRQEREERYATAEKLLRQKRMDGYVAHIYTPWQE